MANEPGGLGLEEMDPPDRGGPTPGRRAYRRRPRGSLRRSGPHLGRPRPRPYPGGKPSQDWMSARVVELDRQVGEAVEIFINERLVARGEIVLVENRLGVTMTEIVKAA